MRQSRIGFVLIVALVGCNPGGCENPGEGNLEVREFGQSVTFQALVGTGDQGYNADNLSSSVTHSYLRDDEVDYSDGFDTSTTEAQREILVMARDPVEYQTTLESINSERNTAWLDNTVGPNEAPDPNRTVNGAVSLPWGLAIPYPIDNAHRDFGSETPLSREQFTGSASTPLADLAGINTTAEGSPQGIYVYHHGVCAAAIDLRSQVLQTILATGPASIRDGINDGIYTGLQGDPHIEAFNLAAFVETGPIDTLFGGFIMQLGVRMPWQSPPFVNAAVIARNYTFSFVLDNGILSATSEKNAGGYDTGFASNTIATSLDKKLPATIPAGIKRAALEQQAQPIPTLQQPAECSSDADLKPAYCYQTCSNVDDPGQWPKALEADDADDSAWYKKEYCQAYAGFILGTGVTIGAEAYGIPSGDVPGLRDQLIGDDGNGNFRNVRCNFHPKYVAPDQSVYGGRPQPVCEFVVRAKRLNVFPDSLELVWFDAPARDAVPSSEYDEAFAVYLLASSQGKASTLCTTSPFFSPKERPFAHVSLY